MSGDTVTAEEPLRCTVYRVIPHKSIELQHMLHHIPAHRNFMTRLVPIFEHVYHYLNHSRNHLSFHQAVFLSGCPPQPPNKAQSKGNKKATSKKTGTGVNSLTDYYFSSLAGNVSSEGSRVTDCEGGVFVLYGDVSSVSAVGQHVCSMIGGRGGGRPGRLQGREIDC